VVEGARRSKIIHRTPFTGDRDTTLGRTANLDSNPLIAPIHHKVRETGTELFSPGANLPRSASNSFCVAAASLPAASPLR
jgi:hypothetical protein